MTAVQEVSPRAEGRGFAYRKSHLFQNGDIKLLFLHTQRYFVDGWHIHRLDNGAFVYVTEQSDFLAQVRAQFVFGTQHQNVRLDTY